MGQRTGETDEDIHEKGTVGLTVEITLYLHPKGWEVAISQMTEIFQGLQDKQTIFYLTAFSFFVPAAA